MWGVYSLLWYTVSLSFPPLSLSIYLPLSIYLSITIPLSLSLSLCIYISISISLSLFLSLSLSLSRSLCIYISIFISLSLYLSIILSLSLPPPSLSLYQTFFLYFSWVFFIYAPFKTYFHSFIQSTHPHIHFLTLHLINAILRVSSIT